MAKAKILFSCSHCGAQAPQWAGQCTGCGAWNSMTEVPSISSAITGPRKSINNTIAPAADVESLRAISPEQIVRLSTGIQEMDRVLGGGLVLGSAVLLGGDPGIGKSTLLLQAVAKIAEDTKVLYVSGEESSQQVALRARRLLNDNADVLLLAETRIEKILATLMKEQPQVVVIDSIQTMFSDFLQSAPGSVSQVRETAAQLVRYAKHHDVAIFLIGHVTKDGSIAGPRVLEHIVDAVLYFEGDQSSKFRIVRAFKNRFGAVNEIGVFAMTETGLKEVSNPSAMFIGNISRNFSGSAILATQEGTRPLLVEVQALVDTSQFGNPRRVCVGLDSNRLAMLLAVMHRHAGIAASDQDVFINVAGGIKVTETASDLAVLIAIVSSLRDKSVGDDLVIFGEVGLGGEIRPVQRGQERIQEAAKLGFKRIIIPKANVSKRHAQKSKEEIQIIPVSTLEDALNYLFE
jgi:DNA repair protein RadA/Sms